MFVQHILKFNSVWVLSATFVYLRTFTTQRLTVEYWIEGHWVFNIYCFVKQIKSGSKSKTHQKKRKLCVAAQIFEMSYFEHPENFFSKIPDFWAWAEKLGRKMSFLKLRNWMFRKLYDEDGCYNLQIYIGIIVYVLFSYCVYLLQHSLFAFINM